MANNLTYFFMKRFKKLFSACRQLPAKIKLFKKTILKTKVAKPFWQRLNFRTCFLGSLSLFFLFFLVYYLVSFWSLEPAEICLAKFKKSWELEKICRADCALQRVEQKKCLAAALTKGSPHLEKKLISYFQDETLEIDFRQEIISVFRATYGEDTLPAFLAAYLKNSTGSSALQATIFRSFNQTDSAAAVAENVLDYYFSVLENNSDTELRLAAAVKISSYPGKETDFSLGQLEQIKILIFGPALDSYLRQSLVLLLGDYQKIFPAETAALLQEIYLADFSDDNISRAFAADFLGEEPPVISQEEWNKYYNR